jgi:hypothetical protein
MLVLITYLITHKAALLFVWGPFVRGEMREMETTHRIASEKVDQKTRRWALNQVSSADSTIS